MSTPAPKGNKTTVVKDTPYQRLIRMWDMAADEIEGGTSGQEITMDVMGKILEADTLEAAFAAQDTTIPNGKDMVDIELNVQSVQVCRSDTSQFAEGLPFYMRIKAVRLDNAEPVTFATGAPNIVTLLWRAQEEMRLPLDCRIASKATASGNTLLMLRLIPKRAI